MIGTNEIARQCNNCHRPYTWAEWNRLPLVGFCNQDGGPLQPGEEAAIELRNCNCDPHFTWHTLAVECNQAWREGRQGCMSGQERSDAERAYLRGMNRPALDGHQDLWRDGW